jgi:hypothetical protein
MHGLRWLGHLVGPGGLILLFTGVVNGLFMRRATVEEETPAPSLDAAPLIVPE